MVGNISLINLDVSQGAVLFVAPSYKFAPVAGGPKILGLPDNCQNISKFLHSFHRLKNTASYCMKNIHFIPGRAMLPRTKSQTKDCASYEEGKTLTAWRKLINFQSN